jgi:2'-5' RNA ligase
MRKRHVREEVDPHGVGDRQSRPDSSNGRLANAPRGLAASHFVFEELRIDESPAYDRHDRRRQDRQRRHAENAAVLHGCQRGPGGGARAVTAPGAQAGFGTFGVPVPSDRLFLALFPDEVAAKRIFALAGAECARHGLRGKPLRQDRLHVTLFHLGDWCGMPADVVAATRSAAEALRTPAFELAFDTVASFPTRRTQKPFVLKAGAGNDALRAFHARLALEVKRHGLARWTRGIFDPHATLAYDSLLVAPHAVEPVAWTAREFVLVHSLLGQTKHVPLARWRLAS